MSEKKFVDLNVEDVDGSGPGLRKYVWVLVLVFILLVSIVAMAIASKSLPFEPLKIYDYNTEELEYCPFEQINLQQDIEIKDEWYYSLSTLEGETYMLYNEVLPYGGTFFVTPVEAMERDIYPSNTLRLAPPVPGVWSAGGKAIVYGYMFGFIPVQQKLDQASTPPYEVKAWDDPSCLGKVLPNLEYPQEVEE